MNLSKYSMIFLVIIIATFMPLAWYIHVSAVTGQYSAEIRADMTNASYDAMQAVTIKDDFAFKTTAQRSEALDAFYMSLSSSYGLTAAAGISEISLTSHVPFVALIDNDGVYVAYSKDYNAWGKADSKTYKISPITTFSETYTVSANEQYTIQFRLDGNAIVYLNGSKIAEGNYKTLKSKLEELKAEKKDGENAIDTFLFMSDKASFNDEKQTIITNVVVRTVENYMNKEFASDSKTNVGTKTGFNLHNAQYQIIIPRDKKSDFANALTAPTVISFFQGQQIQTGTKYAMSFALAGGEIGNTEKYYITRDADGTLYYHSSTTCEHFIDNRGEKDPDSGKYISEERFYTMEEAASLGAYPCPDCIH